MRHQTDSFREEGKEFLRYSSFHFFFSLYLKCSYGKQIDDKLDGCSRVYQHLIAAQFHQQLSPADCSLGASHPWASHRKQNHPNTLSGNPQQNHTKDTEPLSSLNACIPLRKRNRQNIISKTSWGRTTRCALLSVCFFKDFCMAEPYQNYRTVLITS